MKKLIISLMLPVLLLIPLSAFSADVTATGAPVDIDFSVAVDGLPKISNVTELTLIGLEYRNTPGDVAVAAESDIQGVFFVTKFISGGKIIPFTGLNSTYEVTAVYTPLKDYIYLTDAAKFEYTTQHVQGILELYVGTDLSVAGKADLATGIGFNDNDGVGNVLVAQFQVYNPDPLVSNTSGGPQLVVQPFDGSRDMLLTVQYIKEGFLTASDGSQREVTAILSDWNTDSDGMPFPNNIPDDIPEPSNWTTDPLNFTVASPATNQNMDDGDFFTRNDGSITFGFVSTPPPGSCRMTGGGNDKNGNVVLGTQATSEGDRYTYGGQIGAPSADQPEPYGEWTHHQQSGVGDKFIFRSGTHSAPKDTKILNVFCQDPCWCVNARPAPFKQISWDGTGHFANISPTGLEQLSGICNGTNLNKGQLKKISPSNAEPIQISAGKDGSRHYYRVHVNDIGEPGSGGLVSTGKGKKSTRSQCDLEQFLVPFDGLETPYTITEQQCTDCPDTYQIEIHCTDDPASDVMYSVGAFVEGGNLQIHPPVGMHMSKEDKAACGQ